MGKEVGLRRTLRSHELREIEGVGSGEGGIGMVSAGWIAVVMGVGGWQDG
jgi:hypothetical protein